MPTPQNYTLIMLMRSERERLKIKIKIPNYVLDTVVKCGKAAVVNIKAQKCADLILTIWNTFFSCVYRLVGYNKLVCAIFRKRCETGVHYGIRPS